MVHSQKPMNTCREPHALDGLAEACTDLPTRTKGRCAVQGMLGAGLAASERTASSVSPF